MMKNIKENISYISIGVAVLSLIISGLAYNYAKEINESTLKIGDLRYDNQKKIFTFQLINGYYSQYPAYIIGAKIYIGDYSREISITPKNESSLLIAQGSWVNIEVDATNFLKESEDGDHKIGIEIRYIDYSKMEKKSLLSNFKLTIVNNTIKDLKQTSIKESVLSELIYETD